MSERSDNPDEAMFQIATDEYGLNHATAVGDSAPMCGAMDLAPMTGWSDLMDEATVTAWLLGDALDACIWCVADLRGMDAETEDVFAVTTAGLLMSGARIYLTDGAS